MLIFDTETTGLTKPNGTPLTDQPYIIELGVIRLDDDTYKELDRYAHLLDPGVPIDEELHKKITGLTNADLKGQPMFYEVVYELAEFFRGEDRCFCHNAEFDFSLLRYELQRIQMEYHFPWPSNQFCTAEWTTARWGKRMRMIELYEKAMGKPLAQTHRAIDDAAALAEIVRELRL